MNISWYGKKKKIDLPKDHIKNFEDEQYRDKLRLQKTFLE